jgi:CheY-like chemotaxis protein
MAGVASKSGLVLAAEDEESDAILLRMAFGRSDSRRSLLVVRDGQEVIDYLTGRAPYADRALFPLPELLLLDLKMPRLNGFDVLAWLKEKPQFADLPIIMLSSSGHESDIQLARQLGAWDFHVKPHGMAQLVQLVKLLLAAPSGAAMAGKEMGRAAVAAPS